MKSIYLSILLGLVPATFALAQDAITETQPESTIKISTTAQVSDGPDEIAAQITISEYIHTDARTQETTSITLDDVKKELELRIKKLGKDPKSLEFISLSEGNNHYNYNQYLGPVNYNTTQKKLLSAVYYIKWSNEENEFKSLFEAMRFNGFTAITLVCRYSEEKQNAITEKLLKRAHMEAKDQAELNANLAGVTLGDINSLETISTPTFFSNPYTGGNIYYNNSMMKQEHQLTISITYNIKK